MIYFDTTKAARSGHHSGLIRVSACLRAELASLLGERLVAVHWDGVARRWARADGTPITPASADWVFTPELFSEAERPGFSVWLAKPGCRTAAIFHDAIPLKFPQTTWPQSVARHPGYMKLLASFDRVLANSAASRDELAGYWAWGQMPRRAEVLALPLGAEIFSRILDFDDRTTCVLFGDGAGAILLEASEQPGILATDLHADGSYREILHVPGHVSC